MTPSALDGSAAQLVPQAVEKLPLYRWHPGTRVLVVGPRDGAAFDHDPERHDGRSFRRPLTVDLVAAAQQRAGTDGLALAFSSTLAFPRAAQICLAARRGALVVCSNGFGDASLLEQLLAVADAWLLLAGPSPGPLAADILSKARHVEVLVGWDTPTAPLPPLDLAHAAAVHLTPLAAAQAGEEPLLAAWTAARAAYAGPLFDETHQRDDCSCGATLVWRSAGRSRLDALDAHARCRVCGRQHGFALVGG